MKRFSGIILLGLGAALAAAPAGAPAALSPQALPIVPAPPAPADAPVALLVDLSSGQTLFAQEADRRFLPASVTKVMTAYVAFELIAQKKLIPAQAFTVSDEVFKEWSGTGSSMFLKSGERVSVDELLHGITTVSANDGCVVLAVGAAGSVPSWVAMMNRTAHELGMDNSHFGTPNGWPDEGGTFTTANDLAKLARALITRHPDLYARYFGKPGLAHNGFAQANHDPISGVISGADGIKTGFTREAGYNFLGSAQRNGRRLVMVVAGIDDARERTRVSRSLMEWGFSAFERKRIFPAGATVGYARVQNGAMVKVLLRAARPVIAEVPAGKDPRIAMSLRYRGPIEAPIAEGSEVADLEVRIAGFAPYTVPLEAASTVPEANLWQRLLNGVLGLFA